MSGIPETLSASRPTLSPARKSQHSSTESETIGSPSCRDGVPVAVTRSFPSDRPSRDGGVLPLPPVGLTRLHGREQPQGEQHEAELRESENEVAGGRHHDEGRSYE